MILIVLLSIPAVASALISIMRKHAATELIHVSASIASLAAGGIVIWKVWPAESTVSWNLLRADSLSAFMIAVVTFVGAIAGAYAIGYMRLEFDANHFSRV